MDEIFTILHGTTARNAAAIIAGGFRASDPRSAAAIVEEAFDIELGTIYAHEFFAFPRGRRDLDRIHFTTNPFTAWHYSVPEQLQDALSAAHRILFAPIDSETAKEYRARERIWLAEAVPAVVEGRVVLKVEVPFSAIGDNAFGRKITRDEFRTILEDELPEVFSLPLTALTGARITLAEVAI